ncbi:error-prone DNA polymerase [Streptomyces californicus]|uniref:error-prone DNA polymerase n=1 Tax=Streptomyces californicus TaxID=67351 RepID=UPI0033D1424B
MGEARVLRFPTPAAGPDGHGARPAAWAELHVHSSFSFLQGASPPEDLAAEAGRHEVGTLALTDRDSLAGARRLAAAADRAGIATVYGAELSLDAIGLDSPVVLARGLSGYRRLARVITAAQLAGTKGAPRYDATLLEEEARAGDWVVLPGCPHPAAGGDRSAVEQRLGRLKEIFGQGHVRAELVDHHRPGDSVTLATVVEAAQRVGVEVVASGAVHYARPAQARLAQTLTALRRRETLSQAAGHLHAAPTAHIRSAAEMRATLARFPGVYENTVALGYELAFDLSELRPELPHAAVPDGHDESSWLRHLAEQGCERRYGPRADPDTASAWAQLDRELGIITAMGLDGYFLIVEDIVAFARSRDIWCQGRGSAASSVVCYCLGITGVDALKNGLLFERFLHLEKSDPDIDIDFESGRREEVIQYVYERYGRHHAAQVANIITYQPALATIDAARALSYSTSEIREMTRHIPRAAPGSGAAAAPRPDGGLPKDVADLAGMLHGLPRHLGVHSGGMVVTRQPIGEIMPVEWATAEGRSVLQGDKDDVAAAGLVKIDLLGLGMLGALHTACDLVAEHYGKRYDLASIPQDDPDVYGMIADGRTIGVFQAESRAQISTLPQMRPREFSDLAIAASIIRPGPIQAGSKHPYLRRRRGEEPVTYPHPLARPALEKTLGVALYQEQAMSLAIDCAGFTPAEADRLRKAMAAKGAPERVAALRGRLEGGMAARGIDPDSAQKIISMITAFSGYGFPESHAQSMAHLIYASAWLKYHYPEAMIAAILANQPMGFYDSQTLIEEAGRRGVRVLPTDINRSGPHAQLEPDPERPGRPFAIRRGLTAVTGLSEDTATLITAERDTGGLFTSLDGLASRTHLPSRLLERLAAAGALDYFDAPRRALLWSAGVLPAVHQPVLPGLADLTPAPDLAPMTALDLTAADLATTGASVSSHPAAHLRPYLQRCGANTTGALLALSRPARVRAGGYIKYIQRPPTANGMVFSVLEDETGIINCVFFPDTFDAHRRVLRTVPVILDGHLEHAYGAINLVVHSAQPVTHAIINH